MIGEGIGGIGLLKKNTIKKKNPDIFLNIGKWSKNIFVENLAEYVGKKQKRKLDNRIRKEKIYYGKKMIGGEIGEY